MTKLSKYITTALVCGAILTTVATSNTNQTVVHADTIGTVANKEITSLRQNVAKSDMFLSYLDYEYGDHAKIAEDLKSTITVVDQDGEEVSHDLLDWSFKFFRMGWNASELSHTHQYDWSMQNRIYNGNKTGDYGILVPTITLKSNPEVTNTRNQSLNSDWRPQISMGNRTPEIEIAEEDKIIRLNQGDPDFTYDLMQGVSWSDYEDDMRDLTMAFDISRTIENHEWKELSVGTHRVTFTVTDSDGASASVTKLINVASAPSPKILAESKTIEATKGDFDLYSLFEVIPDSLDPNPTLELTHAENLDLTKAGNYWVRLKATNRYGKTTESSFVSLNVTRDSVVLEAEDFEINADNYDKDKSIADYVREQVSAHDNFDNLDISDKILIHRENNKDFGFEEDYISNNKEYIVALSVDTEDGSDYKVIKVTVNVPYSVTITTEDAVFDRYDYEGIQDFVQNPEYTTDGRIGYDVNVEHNIDSFEAGEYEMTITVTNWDGFETSKTVKVTVVDNNVSEPEVPVTPEEPEQPTEPEIPDTEEPNDNDGDTDGEEPVVPTPEPEEPIVPEEPDTDDNDNDSEVPDTEEPVEEPVEEEPDTDSDTDGEEPDNDTDDAETPVDTDTDNDSNDSDGSDNNTEEPAEKIEDAKKGEDELLVANSNNPVTTAVLTALGISTTTLAYLFNPFKKKEEKE